MRYFSYCIIVTFFLLTHAFFVLGQSSKRKHVSTFLIDEMKFKLKYGWLTLGEGKMIINEKREEYNKNQHTVYEIIITGRTAGLAGMFSKVNDTWGAVIDRESFLPYYAYRNISEGNYKLDERVQYNRENKTIKVEHYNVQTKEKEEFKYYVMKKQETYDMISGMMYARYLDYQQLKIGDTISLDAFHEREFYDFKMIYQGEEVVKSKVGHIKCFRITPVVPKSPLFSGKTPIIFWISADERRLPVQVKAKMFFGTAYSHLTSFHERK